MTESERAFLAQMALGWFSMQTDGTILRHVEISRRAPGSAATVRPIDPRLAATSVSGEDGYPRVMFTDGEERRIVAAHRIVWMITNRADIPAPMEINHIDGNKQNHRPSNLELVTRAENVRHAIRVLGRRPKAQDGEANASARLTEAQVMEIRSLWEQRAMSQGDLAKRFGVEQTTISAIVLRKSWRHLA